MNLQPVWDGYLADPFVLRHENAYYAIGTGSSIGDTAMGARQFPLLRSYDLQNWELLGGALNRAPGLETAAHWAPELCFRDGVFYLFYSAETSGHADNDVTQRLRVAVATRPQGPYEDAGLLFPGEADFGFCIDANPFRDPVSNDWFLYFSRDRLDDAHPGTGNAVVKLDAQMLLVGDIVPSVLPSADWQVYECERQLYGRTFPAWHTVEGACVVYRQNLYYQFYSGGNFMNESYGVSFATADNPLGPWHESGRRVVKSGDFGLRGPGHNSLVVGPDERDYLVFHAWNTESTKRQMHLAPLKWDTDGPHLDAR